MKLYELTAQLSALEELLEADVDDAELNHQLAIVSGELREKAVGIVMLMKNLEASAAAIKVEEDRMAARRKAAQAHADRIYSYLLVNMVKNGIFRIESPWFNITVRDNPESVVIEDLKKIPKAYLIDQDPKPDKKKILDDLKQGVVVEGASKARNKSLNIK